MRSELRLMTWLLVALGVFLVLRFCS